MSVDNRLGPTRVDVHLKQHKTVQLRKEVTVVLGKMIQFPLCQVATIWGYLVGRDMALEPAFLWSNGVYLTHAHLCRR